MAKQLRSSSRRGVGRARRAGRALQKALATSAAAAALLPAVAHAEGSQTFGAGAFIGYRFGPSDQLEWGIEGFMTHRLHGSGESEEPRSGVGPLLQISWLGVPDFPRLTLAAQFGGEVERAIAGFTGELGVSYRFGDETGFGIHMGGLFEFTYVNTAFRYQALLDEAFFGGGVRVLPTYGEPTLSRTEVGRPLRTALGRLTPSVRSLDQLAAVAQRDVRVRRPCDRVTDVGLAFAHDAQLERASVPAFLQLAAELATVDAPAELIAAALRAARDEVEHARLCGRLAAEHLGYEVDAVAPDAILRRPLHGAAAWERLACESWSDGCLSEGIAAASAQRAAELATDPAARALQARIAGDEARHAELAWSVLDLALQRGGERTREAVRALSAATQIAPAHGSDSNDLERHGRLGARELARVTARHVERGTARLQACLLA